MRLEDETAQRGARRGNHLGHREAHQGVRDPDTPRGVGAVCGK